MERPRLYAFIAAALLFCSAIIEIVMVITDHRWTRFGQYHNHVVGLLLASLWALTGILVIARRASAGTARAAFVLAIASTVSLFVHSLVGLGVVYMPIAFAVGVLFFLTFRADWDLLRWTATHGGRDLEHPAR